MVTATRCLLRARSSVLVAAALTATPCAWAEADVFGLGDGHHGSLTHADGGLVVNPAAPVVVPAAAGAFSLVLGSTAGFQAGDLVLVVQSAAELPAPDSGVPGPFDLATSGAGRWELGRVAAISGARLQLTRPLSLSFPAIVTQAVRVAEYENVTVAAAASLHAPPWDGSSGGIVALFVSGTLTVDGSISASAAGFRGAQWVPTDTGGDCALADLGPSWGAYKGEGLWSARYESTGRGNVGNAGGGGNCGGGGGGGAHRGAGGNGADGTTGGLGGGPLTYDPDLLVFGGGGGAGAGRDTRTPSRGGAGGGVVFIRAAELAGQGTVSASGGGGVLNVADVSAAGGGAGGSIRLQVRGHASCGVLEAKGGAAGTARHRPAGGGGGGQILFQAASSDCATLVAAGVGSSGLAPPFGPFDPGYFGQVFELPNGYTAPDIPVITSPTARSLVQPRPPISGSAPPSSQVRVYVDGREVGRTTADGDGGFALTPDEELAAGPHSLQAAAAVGDVSSALSEPILVTVTSASVLTTGCTCQASGVGTALLALLGAASARRRPLRPPRR